MLTSTNTREATHRSGSVSGQERAAQINQLLANLTALKGVLAAAVVDRDGFVTHVRRDFDLDVDALGAAVQIVFGAAKRASEHVRQGSATLVVSENKDGIVILAPLVNGFVLAVVADASAMLGSVRFEIKDLVPRMSQLF